MEQGPDGVVVRCRGPLRNEGSVAADECIMTVPLILLRHMEINGLDIDKWYTIRNVYYGRAHKIFMQFSRRWWKDDYDIDHGVTDLLAIRNVVYTPAGQDPSIDKGVIIASYAWEEDSMAYSMLDERSASRRRWRTWRRSIPRPPRRSSSASRTTGRSTATAAASGRCSGRSR